MVLSYSYRQRDTEQWQAVEEPIPLTFTRCHYGGKRPWFLCPGVVNGFACSLRVAILYNAGQFYFCRRCYRLAYKSQSETSRDCALRRAQNIRMRLGGSGSLSEGFPFKPKHMRWRTYVRLRSEAEQAELAWLQSLDIWLDKLERQRRLLVTNP